MQAHEAAADLKSEIKRIRSLVGTKKSIVSDFRLLIKDYESEI